MLSNLPQKFQKCPAPHQLTRDTDGAGAAIMAGEKGADIAQLGGGITRSPNGSSTVNDCQCLQLKDVLLIASMWAMRLGPARLRALGMLVCWIISSSIELRTGLGLFTRPVTSMLSRCPNLIVRRGLVVSRPGAEGSELERRPAAGDFGVSAGRDAVEAWESRRSAECREP